MKNLICCLWLLLAPICATAQTDWAKLLAQHQTTLSIRLQQHDYQRYNQVLHTAAYPFTNNTQTIDFQGNQWEISQQCTEAGTGALQCSITAKLLSGNAPQHSVVVELTSQNWATQNYVLMPAAVYQGNRFESRKIHYSPKLLDPRDIGPDKAPIISDVPRLQVGNSPSRIQQRSGDMSVPGIGFQAPAAQIGCWLLTEQGNRLGDYGIGIEETRDRKTALLTITSPLAREIYQQNFVFSDGPSLDRAHDFTAGESVEIRFQLHFFPAPRIQDLFDKLFELRKPQTPTTFQNLLPFSAAFALQEKKFNHLNFTPEFGYYAVGPRNMFLQDWQIGWTGGMISTYPLLFAGADTTRRNVVSNFNWLFPNGLAPSGYFWDSGEKGTKWYGGDIRKPHTKNWHLVRKSGDGLYYVLKQLMLMRQMGQPVSPVWEQGTRGVADAFVQTWAKWGQWGNFLDNPTGDVAVGGSTSGAIVPAALALAARYFNHPPYRELAVRSGEYYYQNFITKGLTMGGPGDAMQNPDSESSYAMLLSFVTLYEETGDRVWLQRAEEMAKQFASWVVAYDYQFPAQSLFGRMKMQATGTVIANTQNKHSAPGICTHSGDALLRLYRATGNPAYMELLRDIAKTLPQYLSTPVRPIECLPEGWMTERVNITDAMEGIGEIACITTWAETALMLTYIEVPGLYVQPDKGKFWVFDHIEARVAKQTKTGLALELHNPTPYPAAVRVLSENSVGAAQPLPPVALFNGQVVSLKPGEKKIVMFK